ncbi:MAG TPA: RNA polymerase sigma factor [Oceanipulchritudo sp.]|nr:RNA polymerase sigma factor [Oceanipulchritudo sp.]
MGTQLKQEAWDEFYNLWSARLLLFARQQTQSIADAEDILQEAMVSVWSQRERFARIDAGLLFTRIRRLAIDHARGRMRRQRRESAYGQLEESSVFIPCESGFPEELEEALAALPKEQREVLVLKVWGEQTFESIGKTLEISPNTAASRYRYGLERLRRELGEE